MTVPSAPLSHKSTEHYTAQDNGIVQPWEGRAFLNPPFGSGIERFFSKLYQERAGVLK